MKNKLTAEDINRRREQINARSPEKLTSAEQASLAAAVAMDDGTTITLEELKRQLNNCGGRIAPQNPRSLHQTLKAAAAVEGAASTDPCHTNCRAEQSQ